MTEFLEEILARGDVWLAPMEEIAAHIKKATDSGEYKPRIELLPQYTEPV